MKTSFAAALLLAASLLAGCAQDDAPAADPDVVLAPARPGPEPDTEKLEFSAAPQPVLPVQAEAVAATLAIPSPGSRMLLAFDVSGAGGAPLQLRVEGPDGILAQADVSQPGKVVLEAISKNTGEHQVYARSTAAWDIAAVLTVAGPDVLEGLRLQVSKPEQRDIEHRFYPQVLQADAGAPTRVTLYDFDPHAGTANLQHNLHFPELGLKTEGKTTWGEVRVLDLPGLAAGDYAFECEFHGFTGTLKVA